MIFDSLKPDDAVSTMLTTKHEILKWTSSIFNPLGLILPVTITAKLFLQSLWQQNLNWHSQLNEDLSKTWFDIAINITQATAMLFSCQCITMVTSTDLKLHIFTDASPCAYGVVAYLQQSTKLAILMSKSRAAPLKQYSLPRLHRANGSGNWHKTVFIAKSINTDTNVCFRLDSQIVLSWMAEAGMMFLAAFSARKLGEALEYLVVS